MHARFLLSGVLIVNGWLAVGAAEKAGPPAIKDAIVSVRWEGAGERVGAAGAALPAGVLYWQMNSEPAQKSPTTQSGQPPQGEELRLQIQRSVEQAGAKALSIATGQGPRATYFSTLNRTTGVVIAGHVLTVLSAAARDSKTLTIVDNQGQELAAKVLAWDPASSLTVLGWAAESGPEQASVELASNAAEWGSDVRVAHQWKVGNPALVMGIVSTSSEFDAKLRAQTFDVDAKVTAQAIGGPVLNTNFEMVGMVVAQRTEAALPTSGIAVGVDAIQRLLAFVEAGQTGALPTPMIGASLRAEANQVLIGKVIKDGPAAAAGLRSGDKIVSIEQQPIAHIGQVIQAVAERNIGDQLAVKVDRQGKEIELTIELSELQPQTADNREALRATYVIPPNVFIDTAAGLTEEQRAAIREQAQGWIFKGLSQPTTPEALAEESSELESQLEQVNRELAEIRAMLKELKDRR